MGRIREKLPFFVNGGHFLSRPKRDTFRCIANSLHAVRGKEVIQSGSHEKIAAKHQDRVL
jgi:hypothetical protein